MPLNILGKLALRISAVAVAALLAGCATPPPADDKEAVAEFEQINDPLEPTNRAIFAFNDAADTYFLRPIAKGYRYAVPDFGRARIADLLDNLKFPIYVANDLAQGNFDNALTTSERFAINTTFGVAGIMDVAAPLGLNGHKSDLGQTLGVWGVDEGPYLMLPFLGPSNPRDGFGVVAESFADPLDYYLADNSMKWVNWTRTGVSIVSLREGYLDVLDDVKRTSLDYYSALRSLYRQKRMVDIDMGKNPGLWSYVPVRGGNQMSQLRLERVSNK